MGPNEDNNKGALRMDEEYSEEEIKIKVNTLLWMVLPGGTTLDQAEDKAVKILAIIKEK